MWYSFLNVFFFIFHTLLTLFNTLGWISIKTRKWNLLTLLITAFSWFVMGAWYGWGYCFCTDWHYEVRERLGYHDQQGSYIRFLLYKLTARDFQEQLVENVTLIVFLVSLTLSIVLTTRDYKRRRDMMAKSAKIKKDYNDH